MQGPFGQPGRQVAEQPEIAGGLANRVKAVTVQDLVVTDGQVPVPQLAGQGLVVDSQREPVFPGQLEGQREDIGRPPSARQCQSRWPGRNPAVSTTWICARNSISSSLRSARSVK